MNASTLTKRVFRPKAWKEPHFEAPHLIDVGDLVPLGEYRGRTWYTHRLGELEERPDTLSDSDILPNQPLVQEGSGEARHYRAFRVHEPGTFERMRTTRRIPPPAPAPQRPVDALASLPILNPAPEQYGGKSNGHPVRGAERLVGFLKVKGIEVRMVGDALVLTAPGGRTYLAGIVDTAGPLLVPYLRTGKAAPCFACGDDAATIARGWPSGLPWCGRCDGTGAR